MLGSSGTFHVRDATLRAGARSTIVIVGAGPVGLVAAIELARAGLDPIVIEAKDEIVWSSRAICISRRSQEILDRVGAGPAFAAKALPWSRGSTFHRDTLVFRLDMPYRDWDRHAPFVNLQQCHTEQFLLDALHATGRGVVRWGTRLTGLAQDGGGVTLDVSAAAGDSKLRADWVVAADGGRSALRESMGLPLNGTSYENRYLIADIAVDGIDLSVERRVWFDPVSNPDSTVILHVQPDRVWRIDYQLRDDEDAEEALRDENVTARLQAHLDMMGVRAPWRLVWKSVYKALALSLDSYRHGRVLFAGDAAHLVPIFGVRGLNSGIDDAHNLGWKLAMVARGDAPERLLDSYDHERRRATRENHAQATKSTWFMSPPGPGFKLMRDAVLALAAGHPWASALVNPRQSTAHSYDDSPAVQPDSALDESGVPPGEALPNCPVSYVAAARPGASLRRACHLHDALPRSGFTLLTFVDHLDAMARLEAFATAPALVGLPLSRMLVGSERSLAFACAAGAAACIIDEGGLADKFAAARFPLYLVRPDEHVAARFRDADPAAVVAALDLASGRNPEPAARGAPNDPVVERLDFDSGTPLGQAGLECIFETLSLRLNEAGDTSADFLARLSLLLAERLDDEHAILQCVAAARGRKP